MAQDKVQAKSSTVSGDNAQQLAKILGVALPASGEVSVFHSGKGLEAGDHLADIASVLKRSNDFRLIIVPACW